VRLRTRQCGHQLQPTKDPWSPSCMRAYHYMLKALFVCPSRPFCLFCLFFLIDFRGQMSLMGENFPLKPKKKTQTENKIQEVKSRTPVVAELPKAFSKSSVRTVHAKGAEGSPPFCKPAQTRSRAQKRSEHVNAPLTTSIFLI
jgi:hypothetical protein